jgi:hypothetical protein
MGGHTVGRKIRGSDDASKELNFTGLMVSLAASRKVVDQAHGGRSRSSAGMIYIKSQRLWLNCF